MANQSSKAQAVRRIVRIINKVEARMESMNEAADMDALFDAGEFSGPAHWRMFNKDADQIARSLGYGSMEVVAQATRLLGLRITEMQHNVLCCGEESL